MRTVRSSGRLMGRGVSTSGPGGIPACTWADTAQADTHTPPPKQTATAADATHPTGMHSSLII